MTAALSVRPGDPFIINRGSAFGVVTAANPATGRALVAMQNGARGEMALTSAAALVAVSAPKLAALEVRA